MQEIILILLINLLVASVVGILLQHFHKKRRDEAKEISRTLYSIRASLARMENTDAMTGRSLGRIERGDAVVAGNLEAATTRADQVLDQGGEPGEAADSGVSSGRPRKNDPWRGGGTG